MRGNRSGDVVALPADFADVLVEQMCQDLACGRVYRVGRTSPPPNATCFHDCSYRDGRLHNCSQSVGGNCTVINEAICEASDKEEQKALQQTQELLSSEEPTSNSWKEARRPMQQRQDPVMGPQSPVPVPSESCRYTAPGPAQPGLCS